MTKPSSLLEITQQLLERRGDLTLVEIARGADVGIDWLNKFSQGAIEHPSVNRVQAVHDFLAAQQRAA